MTVSGATRDDSPVVVFLGPTLSVADARAELPDALYVPPARCGDVLQALRLSPRALLIIDGTYERTPAVWHKEIALGLERGIPVFGAASMGALRAAEMESLGMIGIGGIFAEFRDGKLVDDDEVAVIHSATGEPLSESMVDIRATVQRAVERGLLQTDQAGEIESAAKQLFYPERSFDAALAQVSDGSAMRPFAQWLAEGGRVKRKRSDALEALRVVARYRTNGFPQVSTAEPVTVPRTSALRVLSRHVACSAYHGENPALPVSERVLQAGRFLGAPYRDAKRLAELMGTLYDVARAQAAVGELNVDATDGALGPWWSEMDSLEWATANDSTREEQLALRDRIRLIARLERDVLRPPPEPRALLTWRVATRESRYLRWLDALDDSTGSVPAPAARVRRLTARAWRTLDAVARDVKLIPHAELLATELTGIRAQLGLVEPEQFERWSVTHRLNPHELGALLIAHIRWHAIASEVQPAALGVKQSNETVHWLLDAMRLSGLYPIARELLTLDPAEREATAIFPKNLLEALDRDLETDEPAAMRRSLSLLGAAPA